MEKIKKIKFSDIKDMLEKDEMREIIGGCGNGGSGNYGFGGGGGAPALSPYSNSHSSHSFSGTNYGGFGGANAPNGGVYGSGSNTGAGENSYPGSTYYNGNNYGTNNLNSSTSGNSYSNNGGWINNSDGSRTTNDPTAISRYLSFLNSNNGNVTNNQMYDFLNRELSAGGREINNNLPGIVLNEVPVVNNYKGPSTIPRGVVYDNGILHINSTSSGQGGGINGTLGVIEPFSKTQVTDGLNRVDFAGMALESVTDFDPLKNELNYSKTFQPVMRLNAEGAYMIALYEKLSLTTYDKDGNISKHTTVGFGHKLHNGAIKSTDPKSITFDQAVTFLAQDIISAENDLNQKIENFNLTDKINRNQYSALVDMTYNAGAGSEKNKTIVHQVLAAMRSGGVEAANKIMENSYLDKTVGGVQDRRYFEAQAFIHGRSITPEQAKAELIKLGLK